MHVAPNWSTSSGGMGGAVTPWSSGGQGEGHGGQGPCLNGELERWVPRPNGELE